MSGSLDVRTATPQTGVGVGDDRIRLLVHELKHASHLFPYFVVGSGRAESRFLNKNAASIQLNNLLKPTISYTVTGLYCVVSQ